LLDNETGPSPQTKRLTLEINIHQIPKGGLTKPPTAWLRFRIHQALFSAMGISQVCCQELGAQGVSGRLAERRNALGSALLG